MAMHSGLIPPFIEINTQSKYELQPKIEDSISTIQLLV